MARKRTESAPSGAQASRAATPKTSVGHTILEWVKTIVVGFVLFLVLRTFLIQTFRITSGSMEGTLLVGDFLVLSKSAYGATVPGTAVRLPGYSQPKRGDVVVFRGHHEPIDLVKRLVGLPGDTLRMVRGQLYVNGVRENGDYIRHTDPQGDGYHPWMRWQHEYLADTGLASDYRPTRDDWGPLVVPEDRYFVLGDNRDESLDSRYWGFVGPEELKGRAVVLYFSFDRDALGPVPVVNQIRWDRIGEPVN